LPTPSVDPRDGRDAPNDPPDRVTRSNRGRFGAGWLAFSEELGLSARSLEHFIDCMETVAGT